MSAVNSSTSVQSSYIQSLSQVVAAQQQFKAQSQSAVQAKLYPVQAQDSVKISDEAQEAYKNLKANMLDKLVTGGTSVESVTKDQGFVVSNALQTALQSYFTAKSQYNVATASQASKLSGLVSNGTITRDQRSAVMSALKVSSSSSDTTKTDPLDKLVSRGVITKDQETAINSALKPSKDSQSTESTDTKVDYLAQLVSKGTITEKQATTIKENVNGNALDTLVSKGTITKAQEGIIKSVLKSALLQTQPNTANTVKPNPLDNLVANGTITQDQESSINVAFEAAKKAYMR